MLAGRQDSVGAATLTDCYTVDGDVLAEAEARQLEQHQGPSKLRHPEERKSEQFNELKMQRQTTTPELLDKAHDVEGSCRPYLYKARPKVQSSLRSVVTHAAIIKRRGPRRRHEFRVVGNVTSVCRSLDVGELDQGFLWLTACHAWLWRRA